MHELVLGAMLHNTATNRWHPIYFRDGPLPGPDEPGKPRRLKSKGHHTNGFDTRELAEASMAEGPLKDVPYDRDAVFPWDGEDIPAITWFCNAEGTKFLF